jgi:phage FluMu protein Com
LTFAGDAALTLSPALIARIRAEFTEMPGLKLTIQQACRLWNLQETVCRDALGQLASEGFLFHTPSGAFVGMPSAMKMLKAESLPRPSRCPHCQHLNAVQMERMLIGPHSATTFRCAACGRIIVADLSA